MHLFCFFIKFFLFRVSVCVFQMLIFQKQCCYFLLQCLRSGLVPGWRIIFGPFNRFWQIVRIKEKFQLPFFWQTLTRFFCNLCKIYSEHLHFCKEMNFWTLWMMINSIKSKTPDQRFHKQKIAWADENNQLVYFSSIVFGFNSLNFGEIQILFCFFLKGV